MIIHMVMIIPTAMITITDIPMNMDTATITGTITITVTATITRTAMTTLMITEARCSRLKRTS